jgi:hypothetical protein
VQNRQSDLGRPSYAKANEIRGVCCLMSTFERIRTGDGKVDQKLIESKFFQMRRGGP